jgi:hypothetical protein
MRPLQGQQRANTRNNRLTKAATMDRHDSVDARFLASVAVVFVGLIALGYAVFPES